MTLTLVLPETLASEIDQASREPLETAGVLVAGSVQSPQGELRLLGQRMFWVPNNSYIRRESNRLTIDSSGYIGALGEAERQGAVALWFHTHPGSAGRPIPSRLDAEVDVALADVFRLRANTPYYGTLIASPIEGNKCFAFTGGSTGKVKRLNRSNAFGASVRLGNCSERSILRSHRLRRFLTEVSVPSDQTFKARSATSVLE